MLIMTMMVQKLPYPGIATQSYWSIFRGWDKVPIRQPRTGVARLTLSVEIQVNTR